MKKYTNGKYKIEIDDSGELRCWNENGSLGCVHDSGIRCEHDCHNSNVEIEQNSIALTTQTRCCEKCFRPSIDSTGEDYVGALPEYCADEECYCHTPTHESWEKELDAWMQFYIDGGAYTPASHIALRQHFRSLLKDQRDRAVQRLQNKIQSIHRIQSGSSEEQETKINAFLDAIEAVKGI